MAAQDAFIVIGFVSAKDFLPNLLPDSANLPVPKAPPACHSSASLCRNPISEALFPCRCGSCNEQNFRQGHMVGSMETITLWIWLGGRKVRLDPLAWIIFQTDLAIFCLPLREETFLLKICHSILFARAFYHLR